MRNTKRQSGKLPGLSERQFQQQVISAAEALGWLCYHTHDSRRSQPGFPDLILVRGSRMIAIELKVGRRKPTPAQIVWLEALRGIERVDALWARPEDWDMLIGLLKR